VHFCLSPGFRPERGGFSYTIGFVGESIQARVIFRFLRARGWNRVALIVSTDATGRLAEARLSRTVAGLPENRDVHVVTVEHFNPTDVDDRGSKPRGIRAAGRASDHRPG